MSVISAEAAQGVDSRAEAPDLDKERVARVNPGESATLALSRARKINPKGFVVASAVALLLSLGPNLPSIAQAYSGASNWLDQNVRGSSVVVNLRDRFGTGEKVQTSSPVKVAEAAGVVRMRNGSQDTAEDLMLSARLTEQAKHQDWVNHLKEVGLPEDVLSPDELQKMNINIYPAINPETGKKEADFYIRRSGITDNPIIQQAALAASHIEYPISHPPLQIDFVGVATPELGVYAPSIPDELKPLYMPVYEGAYLARLKGNTMIASANTYRGDLTLFRDNRTGLYYQSNPTTLIIYIAERGIGNQSHASISTLVNGNYRKFSVDQLTNPEFWASQGIPEGSYLPLEKNLGNVNFSYAIEHELGHLKVSPIQPTEINIDKSGSDQTTQGILRTANRSNLGRSLSPDEPVLEQLEPQNDEMLADIGAVAHIARAEQARVRGDDSADWIIMRRYDDQGNVIATLFGGLEMVGGSYILTLKKKSKSDDETAQKETSAAA